MAVVLNRRGNVKPNQSSNNGIKTRVKTSPKVLQQLKAVKDSIEKSKTPEKTVRVKSLTNIRSASETTKQFVRENRRNVNPATKRERDWKYEKYPSILPPPIFIRKVARKPHAILVGKVGE